MNEVIGFALARNFAPAEIPSAKEGGSDKDELVPYTFFAVTS